MINCGYDITVDATSSKNSINGMSMVQLLFDSEQLAEYAHIVTYNHTIAW